MRDQKRGEILKNIKNNLKNSNKKIHTYEKKKGTKTNQPKRKQKALNPVLLKSIKNNHSKNQEQQQSSTNCEVNKTPFIVNEQQTGKSRYSFFPSHLCNTLNDKSLKCILNHRP